MYCNGRTQEYIKQGKRRICPVCHQPFHPTNEKSETVPWHAQLLESKKVIRELCQRGQHRSCANWSCNCNCHWGGELPKPAGTVEIKEVVKDLNVETLEQMQALIGETRTAAADAQSFQTQTAELVSDFANQLSVMNKARDIKVSVNGSKPIKVSGQHESFQELLEYCALREPVFMRGPAGSGKTSAAMAVAKALGLPFYSISLSSQTSDAKLAGYMDAVGNYVTTFLRKAYEEGGIFLFDEVDKANPSVMAVAHAAIDNVVAGFADAMVERHPDCIFLAAGNTYGQGADEVYVGSAKMDGATLNRFLVMNWDYDWEFAAQLSGNLGWTDYIRRIFTRASELKIKRVIGMRQVLKGAKLLSAGMSVERVERVTMWNGWSVDEKAKVLQGIAPYVSPDEATPTATDDDDEMEPDAEDAEHATGDAAPTRCPKCQSTNIEDNRQVNAQRRIIKKAPMPDFKCRDCGDRKGGWKVWPAAFNWDTKEWTS